jgi:hypothetical protein
MRPGCGAGFADLGGTVVTVVEANRASVRAYGVGRYWCRSSDS